MKGPGIGTLGGVAIRPGWCAKPPPRVKRWEPRKRLSPLRTGGYGRGAILGACRGRLEKRVSCVDQRESHVVLRERKEAHERTEA